MPVADAAYVAQIVIDAITQGSIYALFALGLALIFGIMQLINFAHGELIMVGGFSLVLLDDLPWPLQVGLSIAIAIAFALATERIAFRPVRSASPATLLVTSFAVSYFLQNLAQLILGSVPKSTNLSTTLSQPFHVGALDVPKIDVLAVSLVLAILVSLVLFLSRTRLGIQMRASAENLRMARLLGVRANLVVATAFAMSGLLAGIAASLLVLQTGSVSITMGVAPLVAAFMATVIGGMGSIAGAVIGGYAIGALSTVLQATLPLELRNFRDAFVYGAVLVMLIVRPQGLIVPRTAATRV